MENGKKRQNENVYNFTDSTSTGGAGCLIFPTNLGNMQDIITPSTASSNQTPTNAHGTATCAGNTPTVYPEYMPISPALQQGLYDFSQTSQQALIGHSRSQENVLATLKELERLESRLEQNIHKYKCYCCYTIYNIINAPAPTQVINEIFKDMDTKYGTIKTHVRCSCCLINRK